MDPEAIAGMLFALVMTVVLLGALGGIFLLKPLVGRGGELLELWIREKRAVQPPSAEEIARLRAAVHDLETQLQELREHQEFTEKLLAERSHSLEAKGGPGSR